MSSESHTNVEKENVSLKAVAELAGVHISTVSRVLRQDASTVRTDKARRVLEAAEQLGYRPNLVAASLRTSQTKSIGLVIPRLTDVMISSLCQSIESTARYTGYQLLLATPPDDMAEQMRSVEFLMSRRVDGLILTSVHRDDAAVAEELHRLPIPVVSTNRHGGSDIPSITADDMLGGKLATEYLISKGHTRIGIVAGPRHASTGYDRLQGYYQALDEAGIERDDALVIHTDFESEGGVIGAHSLLSLREAPTAIFAVNDMAAIGVLGAAAQRGLTVPRDLSVVGYNDIPVTAHLPIPLTTIHSPITKMGERAVATLLHSINGEPVSSERLPVSVVVRQSTAKLDR
jgi:LacI family transcriptional regulator